MGIQNFKWILGSERRQENSRVRDSILDKGQGMLARENTSGALGYIYDGRKTVTLDHLYSSHFPKWIC